MVRLTKELLAEISGAPVERLSDELAKVLNRTCLAFGINTVTRQGHFLAQLIHESGAFRYTKEIASGEAYEGRIDLGNTEPGDGVRFKGRGYIQLTGRDNYTKYSLAVGEDFIENPDKLSVLPHAALSAGWFWKTRGLNELADEGDPVKVTRRVNGGINGLSERVALTEKAVRTLAAYNEARLRERAAGYTRPQPLGPTPLPSSSLNVPSELQQHFVTPQPGGGESVRYLLDHRPKWIGFSKTFLGIVITALGVFGKDVPFLKEVLSNSEGLIEAIGLLVTLWGRIVAKEEVSLWPKAAAGKKQGTRQDAPA